MVDLSQTVSRASSLPPCSSRLRCPTSFPSLVGSTAPVDSTGAERSISISGATQTVGRIGLLPCLGSFCWVPGESFGGPGVGRGVGFDPSGSMLTAPSTSGATVEKLRGVQPPPNASIRTVSASGAAPGEVPAGMA